MRIKSIVITLTLTLFLIGCSGGGSSDGSSDDSGGGGSSNEDSASSHWDEMTWGQDDWG